MSVSEHPGVLGVRPAPRRWWARVLRPCLAVLTAAAAVAAGGAAGFALSGHHPPPLPLSATTPGIDIADPASAQPSYDLPGPFLMQDGHTDYLYLSTALGALRRNVTVIPGSPGHWDWAAARDALPTTPPWAAANNGTYLGGQVWEPEVFKFGTSYVMYMSPTVLESIAQSPTFTHCIGVARSASPTGPFTPAPKPIVCQLDLGGDIDAQVVTDPTGPDGPAHPYYLVWKADNNNLPPDDANRFPTGIWAQGLSNDGMSLIGSPVKIFWADEAWQQGIVEAPQMVTGPGGALYLFYSGGRCFCNSQYGMGVARCSSVFGPCVDLSTTPLITTNYQGEGPGEETVFRGADSSLWLLYNPWYTGDLGRGLFRPVEAARINVGRSGPYVAKPGRFPSP